MLKKNWLVLFSVLLLSCDREEIAELGHNFFPLDPAIYRIYDVTETTYVSGEESTETYQIRESISDSLNTTGEWVYVLLLERREDETGSWRSIETVSVRRTNHILDYREQNQSFIKLSFPVKNGRFWNGNALNDDQDMTYSYDDLGNSVPFDQSEHIKVIISDLPANIVEQDERFEIYAKGIGLVERDFKQIQFCQQGCSGVNEPEDGTILYQRLVDYGEF